jgi:hypothetical protein
MENEEFIKASIRERLLFMCFEQKQMNVKLKTMSHWNGGESWDVIYTKSNVEYVAEIKVRDNNLKDWDKEGWILEEYKYRALMELKKTSKRNFKIAYLNIFKDACVIWELESLDLAFKSKECNKNTVVDNGKINKKVALLHSSQGEVYHYNFDIAHQTKRAEEFFNRNYKRK